MRRLPGCAGRDVRPFLTGGSACSDSRDGPWLPWRPGWPRSSAAAESRVWPAGARQLSKRPRRKERRSQATNTGTAATMPWLPATSTKSMRCRSQLPARVRPGTNTALAMMLIRRRAGAKPIIPPSDTGPPWDTRGSTPWGMLLILAPCNTPGTAHPPANPQLMTMAAIRSRRPPGVTSTAPCSRAPRLKSMPGIRCPGVAGLPRPSFRPSRRASSSGMLSTRRRPRRLRMRRDPRR